MQRQNLVLYSTSDKGVMRTVIKTKHGRVMYLELSENADKFIVRECCYLDRLRSGKYYKSPLKLVTRSFAKNDILRVLTTELDRAYYGIEYSDEYSDLNKQEFIEAKLLDFKSRYTFLVLMGNGEQYNGLPLKLTTIVANRIHRKMHLTITYYKDGLGVVECQYCDRRYKARTRVSPQMLTSVFVEYSKQAIIEMVNRELDCDFTNIAITDDDINFENNQTAICGHI